MWPVKKSVVEEVPGKASVNALLLAGIEDTEATIRAQDTKASIALVAHGFIFSGVLAVLTQLGESFDSASSGYRSVVAILLGLSAVAFIYSIIQIVRCVRPAPTSTVPDVPSRRLFFVPTAASSISAKPTKPVSMEDLLQAARGATDGDVTQELVGEILKVSAIRARKVSLASSGFTFLGIEVGLVLGLLIVLGVHQMAV
jgi:hypothetical protein